MIINKLKIMRKLVHTPKREQAIVYQNIINKLTKKGREKVREQSLSMSTVSLVLIDLMESVEKFTILNGYQKKEAVKTVIAVLVDESDIAGELEPVVLRLIPILIDNFIEIKDGSKLSINRSPFRKIRHKWAKLCCIPLKNIVRQRFLLLLFLVVG